MALKRRTAKPSTLGNVAQAVKRSEERRAAASRRFLSIDDGEAAVVRVLSVGADFKDGYVHRVQFEREDGSVYFRDIFCLDQKEKGVPCPGCKQELQRRYKFWSNVIVRDWEDEETGKTEDVLMILTGGVTIADKLAKMDAKHGLRNRDVEISRTGKKKNTKWEVDWADDEDNPMSANDKKLEKDSYDFEFYTTPPDFEDFFKPPSKRDDDEEDQEEIGRKATSRNVLRRGKPDTNGDGADDGNDERPPRRTSRIKASPSSNTEGSGKVRRFGPKPEPAKKTKTVVRRRAR